MKKSKRYTQAVSKIDKKKDYPIKDAISLLKNLPKSKFDETVEVACKLGIDFRKSDQLVRGSVSLPHGIGKEVKVLVFCEPD